MMLQLNPSIEVYVTSKKNKAGRALGWIDYTPDHTLLWIVAFDDSGEVWIVPNKEIRLFKNWSLGRNG